MRASRSIRMWTCPISSLVALCVGAGFAAGTWLVSTSAKPPCQLQWSDQFPGGTDGGIAAAIEFDDGSGEALIVAGTFNHVQGFPALNVARQRADGSWGQMGKTSLEGEVSTFGVFDMGDGPRLFVVGNFGFLQRSVMMWDGEDWIDVGSPPGTAQSIEVFDDGDGPSLFIGGGFPGQDGAPDYCIAEWNGRVWSPLQVQPTGGWIHALATGDTGEGHRLYAGGEFTAIGGEAIAYLASWDGAKWQPVGGGVNGQVMSLEFSPPDASLVVGGEFLVAGGQPASRIARWAQSAWTAYGTGLNRSPKDLAFVHHAGRMKLLAAGTQLLNDPNSSVVTWDGSTWQNLTAGKVSMGYPLNEVRRLFIAGDTDGVRVHAAGRLDGHLATWDGLDWQMLSRGMERNLFWTGDLGLHLFNAIHSEVPSLHITGEMTNAGPLNASGIGVWTGTQWSGFGDGIGYTLPGPLERYVADIERVQDDAGDWYAVGGWFSMAGGQPASGAAKWDGSRWSSMSDYWHTVMSMCVFDDGVHGPRLFAVGATPGGIGSPLAYWNGSDWTPVECPAGLTGIIESLDIGMGHRLFSKTRTGEWASQVDTVWSWDGEVWQPVGQPFSHPSTGHVNSLASLTLPGDRHQSLVACGRFSSSGSQALSNLARWDGTQWVAIAGGTDGLVRDAIVMNIEPSGPRLYVAGDFTHIGGIEANRIASWDGSKWFPLDLGFNGNDWLGETEEHAVHSLAAFDDGVGGGSSLYAAGLFRSVDGKYSSMIARWGRFAPAQPADATGDCTVNVSDLLAIVSSWGMPGGIGDVNFDGIVDITDLLWVIGSWGASTSG